MENTLNVEDFIVLGRTVPEDSKKYGQRVCMAGYSPSLKQFLRVYPLMVPVGENAGANGFRARYQYSVRLRRNPADSRMESWRVEDEKHPSQTPWEDAVEWKKGDLIRELEKKAVPSVRSLNECKLSLGVLLVKADRWEHVSVEKDQKDEAPEHAGLFEDIKEQAGYFKVSYSDPTRVRFAPYIRFNDSAGPHRLQVREWGAYLLMGQPRYRDNQDVLKTAPGYMAGKDSLLVIGNMGNRRTNWLIIKLFQYDAKDDPSLFDQDDKPIAPPDVAPLKNKPVK